MLEKKDFNKIIEEKRIFSVYQPIISIKEKRVVGVEALTRGIGMENEVLPPDTLFRSSRVYGEVVNFDRMCRKNAIEEFGRSDAKDDQILFLNFEPAILNSVIIGSCWMEKVVLENDIEPGCVAIEIVESEVDSQKRLIEFTNLYRDLGFLIVLDDFGAEYSNFNRVIDLKPDIIKIDKKIVNGVSREYYKKVILSSIVNFSSKTGALTLAEGVENIEDIYTCAELGVDLYQGFFFAKPERELSGLNLKHYPQIREVSDGLSKHISEKFFQKSNLTKSFLRICDYYISRLKTFEDDELERFFSEGKDFCDNVQCIYLLNRGGMQISSTNCHIEFENKKLFSPSKAGADHSLKEYFYQLVNHNTDVYLTEPYISLATGNICRTMSRKFFDRHGREVILCIDFI